MQQIVSEGFGHGGADRSPMAEAVNNKVERTAGLREILILRFIASHC